MRCMCCNRQLNDFESTRKLKSTGDYADICNRCVGDMPEVEFVVRSDLNPFEASDDEAVQIAEKYLGEDDGAD